MTYFGFLIRFIGIPLIFLAALTWWDWRRGRHLPASLSHVPAVWVVLTHVAVGGHSLGGAMAANFVYAHADAAQDLVLWAAYPADNNSLAERTLAVISILGTRDGLANSGKFEATRKLLPSNTRHVSIEGGNHAQMGWYGLQGGDGQVTVPRPAQQAQTVDATMSLLASLAGR